MATTQEILELVYRVSGEEEGKKLERLLANQTDRTAELEAELKRLDAVHQGGQIQGDRYATATAAVTKAMAANDAATAKLLARYQKLATEADGARSKLAGFGQTALQSGRIVQDFAQGGIGGILNNIEGFTQALGGGAGLAGVLTIVGVGFALLKPKIMEFWEALSAGSVKEFTSQLDTLGKRIKELEDKPHRLTIEVQELETAKRLVEGIKAALGEIEALRKSQQHYEKEAGAGVTEAIAEAPGGGQGVHQRLRDRMGPEIVGKVAKGFADQEKRTEGEIADAERTAANLENAGQAPAAATVRGTIEGLRKQLETLRDARIAAVNDAIKPDGLVDQKVSEVIHSAKAGAGREQADAQAKLAQLGVKTDTAAELKAADDELAEAERSGARAKAAGEARRRKAAALKDEQKQQVDDLDKSGALEPAARGLATAANATGAAAEDAFATVRGQITGALLAKLAEHGITPEGAEKVANEAAESITKKAFDQVGQNATKAEKAEAKAAREPVALAVAAHKPVLGPRLEREAEEARAAGKTPGEAEAQARATAVKVIGESGAPAGVAEAAAAKLVAATMAKVEAMIAAKVAELPAAPPGAGRRKGQADPRTPQQQAAAALAAEAAAKAPGVKQAAAELGRGLIGRQAEAMNAQGQAEGLTPERARQMVAREVAAFLRRSRPGIDPRQAGAIANQVSTQAGENVQAQYTQALAAHQNVGLATQSVVAQTQQAVAVVLNRLGQLEGRNRQLEANARQLNRQAQEHQPTALNAGGP